MALRLAPFPRFCSDSAEGLGIDRLQGGPAVEQCLQHCGLAKAPHKADRDSSRSSGWDEWGHTRLPARDLISG